MSDPRDTPDPGLMQRAAAARIIVPLTDLCRTPAGNRDRQLLFGDSLTVLSDQNGWSYVQSLKDGYCGHVRTDTLGSAETPTHRVTAPATHAYRQPDIKSPDQMALSYGSRLRVTEVNGTFAQTAIGFIPLTHISAITDRASDPAAVAQLFIGTPYLWGGNSRWGIDCSGLVQAALLACGVPCPGDSDQQIELGRDVAGGGYARYDLLFWKGHVALVTAPDTMIHANAHAMAVSIENIGDAIARITAQGDGDLTAHRRIDMP